MVRAQPPGGLYTRSRPGVNGRRSGMAAAAEACLAPPTHRRRTRISCPRSRSTSAALRCSCSGGRGSSTRGAGACCCRSSARPICCCCCCCCCSSSRTASAALVSAAAVTAHDERAARCRRHGWLSAVRTPRCMARALLPLLLLQCGACRHFIGPPLRPECKCKRAAMHKGVQGEQWCRQEAAGSGRRWQAAATAAGPHSQARRPHDETSSATATICMERRQANQTYGSVRSRTRASPTALADARRLQ